MNTNAHSTSRDTSIDSLRGIAVILMIVAHAIFFFHDETIGGLNVVERILNTITLTVFIFVSGMSAARSAKQSIYISPLRKIQSTLLYIGILYLVYICASFVSIFTATKTLSDSHLFSQVFQAIFFLHSPNFTEYMPLFLFFPLVSLGIGHLSKEARPSIYLLTIIGLSSYLIGLVLYPITGNSAFMYIKELLAGGKQLLQFPILFYTPVYIIGMWWESKRAPVLLIASLGIAFLCHILTNLYSLQFLSIDVRWPPSIGFLSIGISSACFLYYALSYSVGYSLAQRAYSFFAYIGKDALDFWLSHLILLFTYRYLFSYQSGNIFTVFSLTILVILLSFGVSSIGLTNAISMKNFGPISFIPLERRRFRKRYIALYLFVGVAIITTLLSIKSTTIYGSKMSNISFSNLLQQKTASKILLSSEKKWHIRSGKSISPIRLILSVVDENNVTIPTENSKLTIYSGNSLIPIQYISSTDSKTVITIDPKQFPTGNIELTAKQQHDGTLLASNTIAIIISEPLMVSWTFDWEGWNPQEHAIESLESLQKIYPALPFTHFVNPRTFITNAIASSQKESILKYLHNQQATGNEIALHLHMHYDLVSLAGVTPKTTRHWGLRSQEGYDVPTTEYSLEEFLKIVSFAKNILIENGFSDIHGYRAGGWFISEEQLNALSTVGITYDSSGRDKPLGGTFSSIPWNLPKGAQPYAIQPASKQVLLEVPNNGASTYEQSTEELLKRITDVYKEGPLEKPKSLVFVSHPQFSDREFSKIPVILKALMEKSILQDSGPVVFMTTADIASIW